MTHFAEINQASLLCALLQHIGRVARPKLEWRESLRYFQTTVITWGEGVLISESMWIIVFENKWKTKEVWKNVIFFSFCFFSLFLIFEVCQMVFWLIISLLDNFDLEKIEVSNLMKNGTSYGYQMTIF